MSYATMQDVSFALDLNDRELRDRPRQHPEVPAAEPELPKQRGEARPATKREPKRRPVSSKRAA